MNSKLPGMLLVSALACLTTSPVWADSFTLNDSISHSRIVRGEYESHDDVFYRVSKEDGDHGTSRWEESGSRLGRRQLDTEFSVRDLMGMITWNDAPAPDLDLVVLQAGSYYVSWDLSDVDLSKFDALDVINDMIRKDRGSNRLLLGIDSISLYGRAGQVAPVPPPTAPDPVFTTPDGGSTMGLLGLGMAGLVVLRRRSTERA